MRRILSLSLDGYAILASRYIGDIGWLMMDAYREQKQTDEVLLRIAAMGMSHFVIGPTGRVLQLLPALSEKSGLSPEGVD